MKDINVLIVEDERLIARNLKNIVEGLGLGFNVIEIVDNYEGAVHALKTYQVNLALLDISIQSDKNGIDIAQYIQSDINIPFVFITFHYDEDTLNKASMTQPQGYIIKPFQEIDIKAMLQVVIMKFFKNRDLVAKENQVRINDGSKVFQINVGDILYIKSERNHVDIVTESETLVIRKTLKEIVENLPSDIFLQVHRSYIVNSHRIKSFNNLKLLIENVLVPLGRSYKNDLLRALN